MSVGAQAMLYPQRPTPEGVFEAITRYRPTLFFGIPTLFAAMLAVKDAEKRFDASSLRLCVSAGEALPEELYNRWRERFGVEIVDGIGTTEIGYIFISNRPGQTRPGSTGVAVPGYELAIVDDDGRPVEQGEIGNIRVKGDSTMAYYWNKHEKTKETLFGQWIQTGDKYYQDADGYYWYCGRSDDMLKVGGIWVSPVEVEGTLIRHAAVLEAAVVGREDTDRLVKPHAYVVLKDPAAAGDEARGRAQAVREGQDRALQVPALDRVRHRSAQDGHRQDPAIQAAGLSRAPRRCSTARSRRSGPTGCASISGAAFARWPASCSRAISSSRVGGARPALCRSTIFAAGTTSSVFRSRRSPSSSPTRPRIRRSAPT